MKKQLISATVLVIMMMGFTACEDLFENPEAACQIKRVCDLLIPLAVTVDNAYDHENLLITNERTGETFFSDEEPIWGIQEGDELEIAVVVFNSFLNTLCEEGSDAPSTNTLPRLAYYGNDGQSSDETLNWAHTPPIANGGYTIAATKMRVKKEGSYFFSFDANHSREVSEHSYSNNLFSPDEYDYDGFTNGGGSEKLVVKVGKNTEKSGEALEDRSASPIEQLHSGTTAENYRELRSVQHFEKHLKNRLSIKN